MTARRGTAVVVGSSMAGMFAARVLSGAFDKVIVLERDAVAPPGVARRCLPQARHTHVLKDAGHEVLEDLFPGVTRQLAEKGAIWVDAGSEVSRFQAGGYFMRAPSRLRSLFVSRVLLDDVVCSRLLQYDNVTVRHNCYVEALLSSPSGTRIRGVKVRWRRRRDRRTTDISADLVVDATGRATRVPRWLAQLGYASPDVERVRVDIGLMSMLFRRANRDHPGFKGAVIAPSGGELRGGAMVAQERDQWLVTLAGYLGDHPPQDVVGFLDFAKRLEAPDIFNTISTAEVVGGPFRTKFTENRRYRYEHLRRFPEGLLVIGDALCALNPFSGQGIAVSGRQAVCLGQSLSTSLGGSLAHRYFRESARIVDNPWRLSVADDRTLVAHPQKHLFERVFRWYMGRASAAAHTNVRVSHGLLTVADRLHHPNAVFHPRLAWEILRTRLGQHRLGRGAKVDECG